MVVSFREDTHPQMMQMGANSGLPASQSAFICVICGFGYPFRMTAFPLLTE